MNTSFFEKNQPRRLLLAAAATALLTGCTGATNGDADTTKASPKPAAQETAVASKKPAVSDIAPDFELDAINGQKIKLSEMTDKGPVVLIMLRGFPGYQCPICTVQVGQLMGKAKEFAHAKANVLLVYPGPAQGLKAHAAEFVQGKDIPQNFHLLLDPDFSFTNLYGLRWNAKNETSYPSTFVLDKTRKVLFAKISHEHGDRAKVEDVLAALPK